MQLKNKIKQPQTLSSSPVILGQSEVARCAIDEDGEVIYANDPFCKLLGIDASRTHRALDIFNFFDTNQELSDLQSGEYDIYIKDKALIESFYFDWLTTAQNKRYLIVSAIADDLEYEQHDDLETLIARIHDSAARIDQAHISPPPSSEDLKDLEKLAQITHDILMITNVQGDILSANNAFTEIFGYGQAEIQNLSIQDIFQNQDLTELQSSPDGITYFESVLTSINDEKHWIEWRKAQSGAKLYFSGRDITGIKKQEENLKRRERQLTEAETIGRMGHWRWLIGDDEITWSDEIYRVFGVNQNEFTPTINTLTDMVHKRDLGRVVQVFQRAIIEEKNYDMEFRIIQPSGDVRFISCDGRCEKDSDGEVVALYGIIQDMTERMLYEQNLKRAKDTSEQAYAAKSRFLANMSHELRTPLNAIIGFSEMIESEMLGPLFNEKYIEYATSIKESGHHLLDLISDILDMSKIEAGKHTLDLEQVNIKTILERAINMIQGRAQDQKVNLRTSDLEGSNITITGDRRALTQIFLNLLSNAVKFTPAHGSVWVETVQSHEYITIKVCDTGIGIPANKLAAVLKPFEQASSQYTRDHEGTGLGLSITKELVELHGGTMSIDSRVDMGTTVSVRLPYNALSS